MRKKEIMMTVSIAMSSYAVDAQGTFTNLDFESAQIVSAGAIKFQDAPIRQMVELYAELSGREALPLEHFPQIKFSLRNQQPLSGAETIFALEAVAALNNARLESVGDTKVQIVPSAVKKISPAEQLSPNKSK